MRTHLPTSKLLAPLAVALIAASPALGQTAPEPRASTQAADLSADAFARAAAESGLAQLMMSYVALQEAREGPAEDFAWTMIEHHGSALGDLAQTLGNAPGVLPGGLPMEPSAEQAREIERLRALGGRGLRPGVLRAPGRGAPRGRRAL